MRMVLAGIGLVTAMAIAPAQQREIGILVGGGIMNALPLAGSRSQAQAGMADGPAVGVFAGHDMYEHWSGEIRYTFLWRDLRLTSGAESATMRGQAHAIHYDLLLFTRRRDERVRPYAAFGGGAKVFRGTGRETAYRPLMEYGYLTRTRQVKPMLSAGGGVRFRISPNVFLHVGVRDQITPFPTRVITPAPGTSIGGWLHDIVPFAAVSAGF